jgi:predicted DNA-binding ribbon-helix-helix protein
MHRLVRRKGPAAHMGRAPALTAIIIMMRTTVNLPDDLYEVIRSLAATKRISVGQALAELVQKGLQSKQGLNSKAAFPCFSVAPDADYTRSNARG